MRKELIRLYKQFCAYVVETNPNYTDNDFTFDYFMEYLMIDESDLRHER